MRQSILRVLTIVVATFLATSSVQARSRLPYTPKLNYLTVGGQLMLKAITAGSFLITDEQRAASFRNVYGRTQLQEAIVQQLPKMVKFALIDRKTLFTASSGGWFAEHYAALYSRPDELDIVLDAGGDVNARTVDELLTPLHIASANGDRTMVERLLQRGANVDAIDVSGVDAVKFAELGGHQEIIDLLKKWPKDRPSYNDSGLTPLQSAVINNNINEIKRLLPTENIHSPDAYGFTVAHHAAWVGNPEVIDLLREHGSDFKAENDSWTPFLIAAQRGNIAAVSKFIKMRASLDSVTNIGNNALHLATEGQHLTVVNILIRNGADTRLTNDAGETALDIARRVGNDKLIRKLDIIYIVIERR